MIIIYLIMNGMRKVGHKSGKKEDIKNNEDELDLDQGIEDCLDDKQIDNDNDNEKDKLSIITESENKNNETIKISEKLILNKEDTKNKLRDDFNTNFKNNNNRLNIVNPNTADIKTNNIDIKLNEDIILNLTDLEQLDEMQMDSGSVSSRDDYYNPKECKKIVYNNTLDRHLRSIYVKNVDINANTEDLEEHFKSCGEINSITILVDKYTGIPKGYAFIEFTNLDAKENSIKHLNNSLFKGRQIKVEDKRQNLPEYFGKKTKKFNRPVYANDNSMRASNDHFGPIKGKYIPSRSFKPY